MSQGLAKALTEWIELQDLEAAAAEHAAPAILFPGNLGGSRREAGYMAENWLRYKLWFPRWRKRDRDDWICIVSDIPMQADSSRMART